jgi:peptide-methionine (S)-S-oxide reductase
LTHNPEQESEAKAVIAELNSSGIFGQPIVTEVVTLTVFYPAEAYHQGYFRKNPSQGYCQAVIAPKLAKFRKHFASKLA